MIAVGGAAARETGTAPHPRLQALDRLRGLMVVLMVLDHVREYFHVDALLFQPTDLAQTTPALFATRWITHLCAPAFVFLAGASVYLQRLSAPRRGALAGFLVARGAWLIVLELTVIAFAFNFAWSFVFLQVIWVIGAGFLLLAALLWVPPPLVLALGMALVAGHGLLSPPASDGMAAAAAWRLLMAPGSVSPLPGFLAYPLLPWFGVMALGYGLGAVWAGPAPRRTRRVLVLAAVALLAFAILRAANAWGDPSPWSVQDEPLFTVLSFLNVSKYPPSLLYVLVTLGTCLLLVPALERLRGPPARLLDAVGATPFFTYLLHIFLVHGAAMLLGTAMGVDPGAFVDFLGDPGRLVQAGWGVPLGVVYLVWGGAVLVLWPAAAWFAEVRRRHRSVWLRLL